jgi:hypothetical protein
MVRAIKTIHAIKTIRVIKARVCKTVYMQVNK